MTFKIKFLFGIFGNLTSLFLFLSPIPTFKRIIRNKSTEQFSVVPYITTLLNCMLCTWYGLPFVSPDNLPVSTVNGVGAIIESVYIVIFLMHSETKGKIKIGGLLGGVLTIFTTVACVSMILLEGERRQLLAGVVSTVFTILTYASPLTAMRLVIRTKSVEFMPFLLSLFVFLCGSSWLVFGILNHDVFVITPNAFGTALGTAQLILYFAYKDSTPLAFDTSKV